MQDFLTYDLKAGACLAVFYLFYKVLLSRETFHRFNRVLLLSAFVVSFLLPLCTITVYREGPVPRHFRWRTFSTFRLHSNRPLRSPVVRFGSWPCRRSGRRCLCAASCG